MDLATDFRRPQIAAETLTINFFNDWMLEMCFRAYDPCFSCSTHALPGQSPLVVSIYGPNGQMVRQIRREG